MIKRALTRLFNRIAPDSGQDSQVNYVWINVAPDKPDRKPECSVSLKHIDRAHDNARKYPAAEVKIWIDFDYLDERSKKCLLQHHNEFAPKNVTLCDLNDIAQYKQYHCLFDKDNAGRVNIWKRVDLARLIVLKHAMKTSDRKNFFYADFDVPDVRIKDAKVVMSKFGFALATIVNGDDVANDYSRKIVENSYFAFKKAPDGRKFLHGLLSQTFDGISKDENGFSTFCDFIMKWDIKHNTELHFDAIVKRAALMQGYVIPEKPEYQHMNWNAPECKPNVFGYVKA